MPKLTKQFYLEVTVEQFLCACTYLELQEINMRLDAHLRRAENPKPDRLDFHPEIEPPKEQTS